MSLFHAMIGIIDSRSGGPPPPPPAPLIEGFRAEATVSIDIPNSSLEAIDIPELWDTVSGYSVPVFTVPAELNGKYMRFAGGVRSLSSANDWGLRIEADLGSGYVAFADTRQDNPLALCVVSKIIQVSTGDKFRLMSVNHAGNDTDATATFFTGWVLG